MSQAEPNGSVDDRESGDARSPGDAPRVLLVEDHQLYRSGLRTLLGEYEIEVVGEAASGAEALPLIERRRPDVVLMDLHMPGASGVETMRQLLARDPSAKVLVLTVSAADDDVVDAVEAGALGYLLKQAPVEDIVNGIKAVAGGQSVLSPSVARKIIAQARRGPTRTDADAARRSLSRREVEVLRLIAEGKGNAEIAAELFISPATAKQNVSTVMAKLGAANRVQAAIKAVRCGLV